MGGASSSDRQEAEKKEGTEDQTPPSKAQAKACVPPTPTFLEAPKIAPANGDQTFHTCACGGNNQRKLLDMM